MLKVADRETITGHCFDFEKLNEGFVCFYGSTVYGVDTPESDVDLFVAGDLDPERRAQHSEILEDEIVNWHIRNGRNLDEEVPFENKLVYSLDEVDDATSLFCFVGMGPSGVEVPKVRKTESFLNSQGIKLRLALNALTTPHESVCADPESYLSRREAAEFAVTALGIALCDKRSIVKENVFERLTIGPDGEHGELYLGYKTEYSQVADYLAEVIEKNLNRMNGSGAISRWGNEIKVPASFDPIELSRDYTEAIRPQK